MRLAHTKIPKISKIYPKNDQHIENNMSGTEKNMRKKQSTHTSSEKDAQGTTLI